MAGSVKDLAKRTWEGSVHRKLFERARAEAEKDHTLNDEYGGEGSVPNRSAHEGALGHVEGQQHVPVSEMTGRADPIGSGSGDMKLTDEMKQARAAEEAARRAPQPTWLDNYMARPHMRDEAPAWLEEEMKKRDEPSRR
jgi:hypothetical protein